LAKQVANVPFDVLRELEFEQVRLPPFLQHPHQWVVAEAAVAAYQFRFHRRQQIVEDRALSDSQRTCTRPATVSTSAHDNSISSRFASFNFDSPIG
jgi:hypothetical protein